MNELTLQIDGSVIVIPIVISLIVSMIFFVILKRTINSKNELKQINEELGNQIKDIKINLENGITNTTKRIDTIAGETGKIQKIEELSNEIKEFKVFIKEDNEKTNRINFENLEKSINTQLKGLDEKIENITDEKIRENVVVKDEFNMLKDKIDGWLGNDDNEDKISDLFEIIDSDNLKTIQWKCDLLNILKTGYVPEIQDDSFKGRFSKSSADKFIKLLKEKDIVLSDEIERFQINEDEFWIFDYIKNPSQLKNQFDNLKIREKEYQKFIGQNIELVEPGLKVIEREYRLSTGPIDFMCMDKDGKNVGLELKFPKAQSKDVRQLDGYIKEYAQVKGLEQNERIRGILVAPHISDKVFENLKNYELFGKQVKMDSDEHKQIKNNEIELEDNNSFEEFHEEKIEVSVSINDDILEKIRLRYISMRRKDLDTDDILQILANEFSVDFPLLKEILHID